MKADEPFEADRPVGVQDVNLLDLENDDEDEDEENKVLPPASDAIKKEEQDILDLVDFDSDKEEPMIEDA